ncbi:hypothetical protein Tco_1430619 [Tanacetum coccineum]
MLVFCVDDLWPSLSHWLSPPCARREAWHLRGREGGRVGSLEEHVGVRWYMGRGGLFEYVDWERLVVLLSTVSGRSRKPFLEPIAAFGPLADMLWCCLVAVVAVEMLLGTSLWSRTWAAVRAEKEGRNGKRRSRIERGSLSEGTEKESLEGGRVDLECGDVVGHLVCADGVVRVSSSKVFIVCHSRSGVEELDGFH